MLTKQEISIIVECHSVKANQCKTHNPSCHLFHPECAIALLAKTANELLDRADEMQQIVDAYDQDEVAKW